YAPSRVLVTISFRLIGVNGGKAGGARATIGSVGARSMAERGRFELPDPVKGQRFSRPPQSTTLPPLRDTQSLACTLRASIRSRAPNVTQYQRLRFLSHAPIQA